jgi:1-pyrroline-5-carboxylate dehydrogenase
MLGQGKSVWQAEIDAAAETIDFLRFNVKVEREREKRERQRKNRPEERGRKKKKRQRTGCDKIGRRHLTLSLSLSLSLSLLHYVEEIYSMQPPKNSAGVWNRVEYRPLEGT